MTATLYDTIRQIIREEMGRNRSAELAVVQEQHPHTSDDDGDNYACTVRLRDSGIVLRRVPVATTRIGVVSIPAVDDLVLVSFVGGDLNAPIITGRLYNDVDRPPVNNDAQFVLHLPPGAADDEAVHLELNTGDTREILLTLGDSLALTLRDDDPVVDLDVGAGKAILRIDSDGEVTLETQGNLTMKGGGDMTLEGNAVTIKASADLTLKGSKVNIN